MENQGSVPYEDSGIELLKCIFPALKHLVSLDKNLNETDLAEKEMNVLKGCFAPFYESRENKKDMHLSGDRLPNLIASAYADAQDEKKEKKSKDDKKKSKEIYLPSPLYILYQMLTVPNEPQTAAYSLLFCRTLLYGIFNVFPKHPMHPAGGFQSFNMLDISKTHASFAEHVKYNINATEPVELMLAHFIAMKGIFYLRFEDMDAAKKYLDEGQIAASGQIKMTFHKFSYYDKLPDASSLMNELSGIPIPLRGADTVFQGGLRTDSNSNLVVRVSGQPGTGKTSLALALSAALSPYGTQLFYLTLEEKENDLRNRLHSLLPEYLTGLSFYKDTDDWFNVMEISLLGISNIAERFDLFEKTIDKIRIALEKSKPKTPTENLLPSVCPLVIVIDSIRPVIKEGLNLENFIEKCRALNAIVILISSNSENFHREIDYMVDVVINLIYSCTETQEEKPVRILQLSKTRHQPSRSGAHVFHFSGNNLHISPQLPSQVDKIDIITRPLPSYKHYINFFKERNSNTKLVLWDKSEILLHGYGSSGKAGLALYLLMYPLKKRKTGYHPNMNDPDIPKKRKTLVISLLYPSKYYENLVKKMVKMNKEKFQNLSLECLYFYSGYLTPEDFINKILTKLDTAILNGEPFTGILLDGLHNAPLQFPKLKADDMVWSTLYSLLAKYSLTIVTTYTNFKIEAGIDEKAGILLKDDKLLLNLMIQSADYYLSTTPEFDGRYAVKLKSAIRHKVKIDEGVLIWDREGIVLEGGEGKQSSIKWGELPVQEEFHAEDDD